LTKQAKKPLNISLLHNLPTEVNCAFGIDTELFIYE